MKLLNITVTAACLALFSAGAAADPRTVPAPDLRAELDRRIETVMTEALRRAGADAPTTATRAAADRRRARSG